MDILRCKYAYDVDDEGCKVCDGITCKDGKLTYPATCCGGYSPYIEDTPKQPEIQAETGVSATVDKQPYQVPSKAKTTVIKAESGLTREIKGTYFKFMYSEERVVSEDCDLEKERQLLWEEVNRQVDEQLSTVLPIRK